MAEIAPEDFVPAITCDRCVAPGTCCKAFPLNVQFPFQSTPDDVLRIINEKMPGIPFLPLRRENYYCANGKWVEDWRFHCPKLSADGSCTIYEDRPLTCKLYEPGCDHMCVHMRLPNGQPIIPLLPLQ